MLHTTSFLYCQLFPFTHKHLSIPVDNFMENSASYCGVIHTINIRKRANLDINKGHHFIKAKSTG